MINHHGEQKTLSNFLASTIEYDSQHPVDLPIPKWLLQLLQALRHHGKGSQIALKIKSLSKNNPN